MTNPNCPDCLGEGTVMIAEVDREQIFSKCPCTLKEKGLDEDNYMELEGIKSN